jgi:menaquinone-9 beta-reductase
MTTKLETKAIIIGAGPAGAGTSIYLTKAGIPHIIIEKDVFPRDKVCGDACSSRTAFVLRKANPDWLQEIFDKSEQFKPTAGGLFVTDDKYLSIAFNSKHLPQGQTAGFTTRRLVFDQFLFEKLPSPYATIYQNASVNSIERNDGVVKVTFAQKGEQYEVTAPLIIGADGDKSLVRKQFLNNHAASKTFCVALRTYYTGVSELKENHIELHYLPEILPGYFWIFQLADGTANVGLGMLSDWIRKKKINLREVMLRAIENNPHLRDRFANAKRVDKIQGWGIPMCMKRQTVSGDRFMLTGDAAGLVDAFTGEGIGNALYSGMLAADAIRKAHEEKRFDAAFLKKNYDDVLYKCLGDDLKTSVILQRLCHYPWLFKYVIKKAHKSPTFNAALTNMYTGIDMRTQLKKPSFYAKILFNK